MRFLICPRDYIFGTTKRVIDCAGKVVLIVLVAPPAGGGLTAMSGCARIPAGLGLLYRKTFAAPLGVRLASEIVSVRSA